MATKTVELIEIKPIEIKKTTIRIVGDTPLIMHKWSEKSKRQLLEKHMKKTKTAAKEAQNPVEDFIHSMYWLTPEPTEMTEEAFEQIINTINAGGYACGVGEWRPERDGQYGMFHVAST